MRQLCFKEVDKKVKQKINYAMKNGQLKPGSNLQISTHDQFIVHYSLHQNQADALTLCPLMERYENQYDSMPDLVVADVEVVFAAIKHNNNFRRFNLRELPQVEVETGLLAIAHNLAKMAN